MKIKKFLTFLLTLAMVVSLLPAAVFAANNTATTMRLAKTQGIVAVTNATGKKVPQTANMKLYNGYKIRTGAKSYAWISLDDTKAAKLDANSVVSVQKSGQKLTLYLSSGNIFFNVKEKLSGGESFHIKTSTMTTGIRGTSGCVRVINPRVTEIHLLTGQIEVYTENPELHISKTAVLTAGQKATSLIAEDAVAATGEQADIIIERLTHQEVCGNCSTEIAADPALVERIEEEAPHLLPEKVAEEAEERLEAEEEAAEEKQEAIDEAVARQDLPEAVDPYFEVKESSGGGGGGGGSSAPVTPPAPAPTDPFVVSSWSELVEAVRLFNEGAENKTITLAKVITQDTNDTVEVENNGYNLTIDLEGYGIEMDDTIYNEGNLLITNDNGYITTTATTAVENDGTFTLDIDGSLQASGVAVSNSGTFNMEGGILNVTSAGGIGVYNTGTATLTGGTITIDENATGAIGVESSGTLELGGNIIIEAKNGTGVNVSGNSVVTLGAGASVMAYGSVAPAAQAVVVGASATVARPIRATISAERYLEENDQNIITPFDTYMTVRQSGSMFQLVDNWGNSMNAADWFITQLTQFNTGTGDKVITLSEEVDLSTATKTMPSIGASNDGKVLSINLNGQKLILTEKLTNLTTLEVDDTAGGGTIKGKTGAAMTSLIANSGILYWEGGEMQVTGDQDYGIYNAGDFYMNDGRIMLTNTTASQKVAVFNTGSTAGTDVTVNGGLIQADKTGTGTTIGIQNSGSATATLTLKGGVVSAQNGATAVSNGNAMTVTSVASVEANGASSIGIHNAGTKAVLAMDGGTVTAYTTGARAVLNAQQGTVNLSGGEIIGENDAIALYNSATVTVADGATVKADEQERVCGGTIPAGYALSDTETNGYYYLVKSEGITTWAQLVQAVADFNDMAADGSTMTVTLGADIPAATETNPATMDAIASGNKHLVIDLNNHDLTLPQTITVDGNLELVGGGTIDSTVTVTGTATKLFDVRSTGSIEMNSNTSGAPTIDVAMNQIAINSTQSSVYMNAGQILLNENRITGIYSTDGYVYMTGGEIVLFKYEDGRANIGIQAMSGAEVTMSGGTIREDDGIKDVETALDDNYAIYASGSTVALTGGTVSVHNGTAIGVTDPSQLTLGSAAVTGKDAAKLLVTGNDDETGFITSAYDATYFLLQNDVPGINTWAEFETAVAAFNAGTINTIELAGDVDPTPAEAAAAEAAGALAIGNTSDATLTIDLNGYTLALPTPLETGSGLDLVIDGGGGQIIVDDDWNAGFFVDGAMIENYADLTLENGTMVVSDALTGVMNAANSFTLGDNGILRVDNGTGVDNDTGAVNMSSSASIIVNSGAGVINFNNPFTMDGGTITADGTGSTGVNAVRTNLIFGEITATDGAAAVSSSQDPLALGDSMIVRADDAASVYKVTGGGTLVNYEVVDGGDGYYYLKAIN